LLDATVLVVDGGKMASITLKKIPDRLHRSFKARASANHRSLQAEIIRTLEQSLGQGDEMDAIDVSLVAGMMKPKRKGVTIEAMKSALDTDVKKQWNRS
jgi:plasmid stability protein